MRTLVALIVLALAACGPNPEAKPKRVRKPPSPPSVTTTVRLPGEDGRVHVIEMAGRDDVFRCLVHVGPTGSSIACLPTPEMAPIEYAPER